MKGTAVRALALAALGARDVAPSITSCARAVLTARAKALRGIPGRRGNAEAVVSATRDLGPGGLDWRGAIWRGRASYPWRSGSPPPLRLPGGEDGRNTAGRTSLPCR